MAAEMIGNIAVWVLVLNLAGSPPTYVEPWHVYASPFACDAHRLFFVAMVNVPGEFKCERVEVTQ